MVPCMLTCIWLNVIHWKYASTLEIHLSEFYLSSRFFFRKTKCPLWGSNSRPSDYETDALTNCAKKASGNGTWPLVPKSNDLGLVLKSVLKVKSGLWWNKIYFWKKFFFVWNFLNGFVFFGHVHVWPWLVLIYC